MKRISFDYPAFKAAVRTAGALVAGNGFVQLVTGGSMSTVLELIISGAIVIVITCVNW